MAAAQGLAADEVLINRQQFDAWRDRIYELEAAIDDGLLDARYDRRHLAFEMFDRMLVRAEKLGVLRFV